MDLKEWFDSLDLQLLKDMVSDREQENHHLEFKIVRSATLTHKDDKENFARTLSAFSNADGGLIIWGIYAAPNKEGVDCAQKLDPIDKVSVLRSRLETHILVNGSIRRCLECSTELFLKKVAATKVMSSLSYQKAKEAHIRPIITSTTLGAEVASIQ